MENKKKTKLRDMTSSEAKQDFKETLQDKDMSPMLEFYYSLIGYNTLDDPAVDDVINYYSKIKNNAEPTITETMYATTNEGVREVFEDIDVKGKRVATVGSSGDQALHAIYFGASEVDLIDANVLTKALVELKIAAIKAFDIDQYEDFIDHIDKINRDIKYNRYYQKLSHLLPEDVKVFWDTILMDGGENENFSFSRMFFTSHTEIFLDMILQHKDSYEQLKKILISGDYKLNYIVADIADFPKELKGKYDLILLSNIIDYCNLKTFNDVVTELYANNLNIGGYIQLTTTRTLRYEAEALINDLGARKKLISNGGIMFAPSLMLEKARETRYEDVKKRVDISNSMNMS